MNGTQAITTTIIIDVAAIITADHATSHPTHIVWTLLHRPIVIVTDTIIPIITIVTALITTTMTIALLRRLKPRSSN